MYIRGMGCLRSDRKLNGLPLMEDARLFFDSQVSINTTAFCYQKYQGFRFVNVQLSMMKIHSPFWSVPKVWAMAFGLQSLVAPIVGVIS